MCKTLCSESVGGFKMTPRAGEATMAGFKLSSYLQLKWRSYQRISIDFKLGIYVLPHSCLIVPLLLNRGCRCSLSKLHNRGETLTISTKLIRQEKKTKQKTGSCWSRETKPRWFECNAQHGRARGNLECIMANSAEATAADMH